jgi:molybdopterin-containing oxidoreductase family membrane subunit
MIVQKTMYAWTGVSVPDLVRSRMKNLLGTFIAAVLYFVIVYHLTNLYFAKQTAFEQFILINGGIFPLLFWGGYLFIGTLLPLFLIYHPAIAAIKGSVFVAAALVIVGAFCQLYVFIIGGQAFPLEIFPGMTVSSTFYDGQIEHYVPSLPEMLLGIGGIGLAFVMTVIGVRVLHFMPQDDLAKLQAGGHVLD